jgi:Methyl-viologen-reducing hydrogenase, delta subunit
MTQKLLDLSGIGKERLHLAWCSSAEGQRFAEIISNVTESIRSQGKFDSKAFALELNAAEMTLNSETLRWLVGKEVSLTVKGDVYGRKWDANRYEAILETVLKKEYHQGLINLSLKDGFSSVRDISKHTGLGLLRISQLLSEMEKSNQAVFKGYKDRVPAFEAP